MRANLRVAVARLVALFRHAADDRELRDEIDTHLAMRESALVGQGVPPVEARRQARLEFGAVEQLREAHRELRGSGVIDSLGRDFRSAVRSLRRDVSLTVSALLIIGLGVGACTCVFSVVDALLIRPLPFADPDRLVWIANGTSDNLSAQTTQVSNLLDLRARSRVFTGIAGFSPFYGVGDVRLTADGPPERLTQVPVTEGFFPLLGIRPLYGRLFTTEECRWNAPKVVLLDHGFFQRRFGGDPTVVGRTITLDDVPTRVVGVLPPTFDFSSAFTPGGRADVFAPYPLTSETDRRGNTLALVGRLASTVDARAAEAEANAIAAQMPTGRLDGRSRNGFHPRLTPLHSQVSGRFRSALAVVSGAVGFLLLLVCANISNLLLAKGATRRREMAVRAALGAGRRDLIRQLLIEATLLSGGGALLGLGAAMLGIRLLAGLKSTTIPLLQHVRLDTTTLAFTVGLAILTSLVTGLLPALQISTTVPSAVLTDGSRGSTQTSGRLRQTLVIVEVAVVCVMLMGAGLLARSLVKVLDVQPGFNPDDVTTVRVDPGPSFRSLAQRSHYFDEVIANVVTLPDVESAGLTDALPFGNNYGWRRWSATTPDRPDAELLPLVRMVDAGYFHAMQMSVAAGRAFTPADDASAEPVIIVNEALARAWWPAGTAVGRTLKTAGVNRRVIGVVPEARYFSLERESGPEMYMPLRQTGDFEVVNLVVRSGRSAAELTPLLRAALASVDPSLPVADVQSSGDLLDRTVFARRSVAMLVLGVAIFGLALAALGLYAVIAHSVHQRRQEIGIRLALGASPRDVQRRVLVETIRLAGLGMAIGVPASWITSRAIQGLLFGIEPADPVTVVVVLGLLTLVAALAGALPARWASRVDAVEVLRSS